MAYEEAPYNIVQSTEGYEIRHYKDRLVVEVINKDNDSGFRKLFRYFLGKIIRMRRLNDSSSNTGKTDEGYYMQFYLPSKFTKENAPLPNNPEIKISTIEEGYFAEPVFWIYDNTFFKHRDILNQRLLEDKAT